MTKNKVNKDLYIFCYNKIQYIDNIQPKDEQQGT